MIRRLIVLDFGLASIRQLFAAMPSDVEVVALTAVSPGRSVREALRILRTFHQDEFRSLTCQEERFLIPGWSLARRVTSSIVERKLKKIAGSSDNTAIIYMFPQYAQIAKRFRDYLQIYFAVDPYKYYGWDETSVLAWEKTLHENCRCSMGVSRLLCDDFRQAGAHHVIHMPNGVAASFLDEINDSLRPKNLPPADRLLVGCTGNINDTYDWEFIDELARRSPDVEFVFIGPIDEHNTVKARQIRRVMERANVRHLGACRHQDLPRYLRHFDVCLNPLRVNEQNHRRSPLRLYDFLSSGRYILSTDIAEAAEHAPFVHIAHNAAEGANFLQSIDKGEIPSYRKEMLMTVSQQTWQHRAKEFLQHVNDLASGQTAGHSSLALASPQR